MFVNDSDVDSQADKEIEETNEPDIDYFEELEETNKNIDEIVVYFFTFIR